MKRKYNLPYFATYNALLYIMCTHVFGTNFQEKNLSLKNFNSIIYLFIFRRFLYYKGILAFIFEHIMV